MHFSASSKGAMTSAISVGPGGSVVLGQRAGMLPDDIEKTELGPVLGKQKFG